ncbi:MAG TPA: TlpA disulfide reductase family protein, partial [Rhodanobacter sp.]|nr:TlpA disulfide reductase family protein [Rhodanobacter sp.]
MIFRFPRPAVWTAISAVMLAFAVPAWSAMPAQPTLQVTTLQGKTFDLAAQRGKWVIVNFWATWCVPCIKEMPDISRFVAAHPNVRAIGLAYEDSDPAD